MATSEPRRGVDTGPNSRPLNDTVAQTGPGIPDDTASEGYDPVAEAVAHDEAATDAADWGAALKP